MILEIAVYEQLPAYFYTDCILYPHQSVSRTFHSKNRLFVFLLNNGKSCNSSKKDFIISTQLLYKLMGLSRHGRSHHVPPGNALGPLTSLECVNDMH